MSEFKVLSVVSEVYPLVKTGGLADVAGALPAALAPHGVDMRTLIPGYAAVLGALTRAEPVHHFDHLFGGPARLLDAEAAGLRLFVIDAPHLYDRPGGPYSDPAGVDWPDNAERFAALGAVASGIGRGLVPGFVPAVVHAHDWQAGLAPAYLHYSGGWRPGTVITIHNMAFQGKFPGTIAPQLGFPPEAFSIHGIEYYGAVGYLKAGLKLADRITTVSPTYASEILLPEGGMGLEGLLNDRADVVSGILNGLDTVAWDPATDDHLAARFDVKRLKARDANKAALQRRFGLHEDPDALLFGVVSRLSWQKGLDLLAENIGTLLEMGGQLALLGSGDAELSGRFSGASEAHAGRVATWFGYDEGVAHLVQAGADALIVPSRFEPCGLTQLAALRYGALPVVARVGGLADTVIDVNEMARGIGVGTGVQFSPVTAPALHQALRRTRALFQDKVLWRKLQRNAMTTDVSWQRAAGEYDRLYRTLAAERGV
ncbi:glycogen synthase GlgA [Ancylobacter pratisalsi]|uniref:Glycogen synthase n=1 Tax=Ancylobacter pratisalsi TaxID=1745854 RepID=A0A6P1YI58_9HYPH|nr:glycogen synthase GlgA [Ancylobacter pratisalsi]QIB33017.1 glycogen synthase GlgA [Ancylobacter pratisalsi]